MADNTNYTPLGADPEKYYGGFANVVGMPHSFIPSADPGDRAFTRHMLAIPPLVMIRPGRVQYTDSAAIESKLQSLLGLSADQTNAIFNAAGESSGTMFDINQDSNRYGVDGSELKLLNQAISEKQLGTVWDVGKAGGVPVRYFDFKPELTQYMSVLATLSSRVYARMTSKGDAGTLPWFNLGTFDPKSMTNGGFMTFWADNASNVSESASAEVGQTAVAGAIKAAAETSREAQFIVGKDWHSGSPGVAGDVAGSVAAALGSNFSTGASGVKAALADAILGVNPLFPEVWKDSSFARSYDLSFRFHSPYGAPGAIYQNVLLPFLQLLSLVVPVMHTPGTYTEPFVFQLDCPGHFACDLGICTDFSFTRGGAEHLWTKDGLPRQIDVTMRVKDLYPTLMASHNNRSLYFNIGMGTFLDNMASIDLFTSTQATSPLTYLQANIQRALTQGLTTPNILYQNIQNFIFQKGGVASLFRGL